MTISNQEDMIQLSITSIQRDDQGMYRCLATNDELDSAQATIQLAIGAIPPHLKETFTRQILHPGSSHLIEMSRIRNSASFHMDIGRISIVGYQAILSRTNSRRCWTSGGPSEY